MGRNVEKIKNDFGNDVRRRHRQSVVVVVQLAIRNWSFQHSTQRRTMSKLCGETEKIEEETPADKKDDSVLDMAYPDDDDDDDDDDEMEEPPPAIPSRAEPLPEQW